MAESVLIVGASARAAALSALRAGLEPRCADLFADVDLRARCAVTRLPAAQYPDGFRDFLRHNPGSPWMYTGGMETRPLLVSELAQRAPLWGNDEPALRRARSPRFVAQVLQQAGLTCPGIRMPGDGPPPDGHWLVKPVAGVGGAGIHFLGETPPRPARHVFWQEYIEGEACSAVYVADQERTHLLGVTRQLVGVPWLHAAAFHYCGSVSRNASPALRTALEHLGNTLAAGCGLRGLFGIDFIRRDDTPWPVEINPRYTASVEVLEYSGATPALALHQQAFEKAACTTRGRQECPPHVGKAILFARAAVTFPDGGPWLPTLQTPRPIEEMPPFADIPHAGEPIPAGRPICTVLVRADSETQCLEKLRDAVVRLEKCVYQQSGIRS
jgi:predicted ATP-grasp superfamily ATP-dependent carboligase